MAFIHVLVHKLHLVRPDRLVRRTDGILSADPELVGVTGCQVFNRNAYKRSETQAFVPSSHPRGALADAPDVDVVCKYVCTSCEQRGKLDNERSRELLYDTRFFNDIRDIRPVCLGAVGGWREPAQAS